MKNSPVTALTIEVSAGLNFLANIGTPPCFNSNSVLFALFPFTALYKLIPTDSVTRPITTSGGVLNKSRSV
jgi:hypothetical protein